MKIGILTYHRVHNYGAVLQAYALRSFLQSKGHEVEFIDYWPSYHADEYSLFHFYSLKGRSFIGIIKAIIVIVIGFTRILKRHLGFKNFIKQYLNVSDHVKFKSGDKMSGDYDVVVYGGDQIWRKQHYEQFKNIDTVYFSDNCLTAKKHIAYAASMGIIDINSQERELLKTLLKRFGTILVREKNLCELVVSLGYPSDIVLDPVFLLSQNEWKKLIPDKNEKSKYILFYHHNISREAEILVDTLRTYYKYEVKIIRSIVFPLCIGKQEQQTLTPIDFLYLLSNAEFVVSTSFHGVAFSVVFEKQFYALGMKNNSERVKTLLQNLTISERYLEDIENVDFTLKIDYSKLTTLLSDQISDSKNKLITAVMGE